MSNKNEAALISSHNLGLYGEQTKISFEDHQILICLVSFPIISIVKLAKIWILLKNSTHSKTKCDFD